MSKAIPIALATHKASSSATLTDLLLIGPTADGVYVSLTLLDADVVYDNGSGARTYKARTGIEFSAFQSAADLSVDNAEGDTLYPIAGFETEGITQAQIDAGVFDAVPFVVYRVNYNDLTAGRHEIIAGGTIGEIRRKVGGLTVLEFRALSQQLKQSVGELYSIPCRATFGSQPIGTGSGAVEERFPCGKDVSALWVTGIIATDVDGTEPEIGFTDSSLAQATDYFQYGVVECTAGANLGQTREIASYSAGGVFVLQFPFSNPISIADEFRARPGCSKLKDGNNGCVFHFDADWVNHYRGELYIPVADAAQLLVPGAGIGRVSTPTGTGETPTTTPPTPDPPPSGGGTSPGSPTARTRGTTVVDPVDYGADPTGVSDSTAAFNAAYAALPASGGNQGGTVRPSAGTYKINPNTSVKPLDYTLLDLATNNVTLQASYTATDHKYVVLIQNKTNVEIAGGAIIGYRDAWSPISGTTSEWGHGIACYQSSQITIRDISVSKCVGDGMSLSGTTSDDIQIDNVKFTNNRRNNLSVGTSTNVVVSNSEFSYANGTSPKAGIDVECDNPNTTGSVHYVTIDNCHCHHNAGPGIHAHKSTYNLTITNNTLEYNSNGLDTDRSTTATVTGNTIQHNKYLGIKLLDATTGYTINSNDFFNNSTSLRGVIDTGSFTTRTGTSAATADHISISSDSSATVGTNDYGP